MRLPPGTTTHPRPRRTRPPRPPLREAVGRRTRQPSCQPEGEPGRSGPDELARRRDKFEPFGRRAGGSARYVPRPSSSNSRGSRVPGTREGGGRCSGHRPSGRGQRTGRPARAGVGLSPIRRARRGPRPVRRRSGSSGRCAGPSARGGRQLRGLTYRTYDRHRRYQRVATGAMTRHAPHRWGDPIGGRGREDEVSRRWRRGRGGCRARSDRTVGGLGNGVPAFATEERTLVDRTRALRANRHGSPKL